MTTKEVLSGIPTTRRARAMARLRNRLTVRAIRDYLAGKSLLTKPNQVTQ